MEKESAKLRGDLARFRYLLGLNTDPQADKVIRQLIDETEARLRVLDPSRTAKREGPTAPPPSSPAAHSPGIDMPSTCPRRREAGAHLPRSGHDP